MSETTIQEVEANIKRLEAEIEQRIAAVRAEKPKHPERHSIHHSRWMHSHVRPNLQPIWDARAELEWEKSRLADLLEKRNS